MASYIIVFRAPKKEGPYSEKPKKQPETKPSLTETKDYKRIRNVFKSNLIKDGKVICIHDNDGSEQELIYAKTPEGKNRVCFEHVNFTKNLRQEVPAEMLDKDTVVYFIDADTGVQTAIDAANSNDIISLLDNHVIATELTCEDKIIIIDLCGCTLKYEDGRDVESTENIVIKDSTNHEEPKDPDDSGKVEIPDSDGEKDNPDGGDENTGSDNKDETESPNPEEPGPEEPDNGEGTPTDPEEPNGKEDNNGPNGEDGAPTNPEEPDDGKGTPTDPEEPNGNGSGSEAGSPDKDTKDEGESAPEETDKKENGDDNESSDSDNTGSDEHPEGSDVDESTTVPDSKDEDQKSDQEEKTENTESPEDNTNSDNQ